VGCGVQKSKLPVWDSKGDLGKRLWCTFSGLTIAMLSLLVVSVCVCVCVSVFMYLRMFVVFEHINNPCSI